MGGKKGKPARPLGPGDHSECGPDCCITGDLCDGSHVDEAVCLSCDTELLPVDDDPNGDKNAICARCRAEEEHDFDAEPGVVFDRSGNRVEPFTAGSSALEIGIAIHKALLEGGVVKTCSTCAGEAQSCDLCGGHGFIVIGGDTVRLSDEDPRLFPYQRELISKLKAMGGKAVIEFPAGGGKP